MEAPTKSKIDPKLGTDSAMKSRQRTENVLKAHRFQLKSEDIDKEVLQVAGKRISYL